MIMAKSKRKELEDLYQKEEGENEITFSKEELIRMWELGILNDYAYFFMAMRTELTHRWKHLIEEIEHGQLFPRKIQLTGAHIDYLICEWRGKTPKNDAGDLKEMTVDLILSALAKLQKKELAIAHSKQLTLLLGEEAPFTPPVKTPHPEATEA
ncbi:MAG: hypothetical protein DCF32_15005 [Leptolyngbya sp.]|nr:MAG: hypothetical protein DCF32_15005 [Leptolyngbya sp.]